LAPAGVVALVLLILGAGRATAEMITYTMTLTASGSLGGASFNDALITITETSDTSNVRLLGPRIFINDGTTMFTVAGVGGGTFNDLVGAAVRGSIDYAGFGDSTAGTSLYIENTAFSSYDLSSSIGPLTGTATGPLVPGASTTSGLFELFGPFGDGSFTAVTVAASSVPEPASLTLALVGAGTLAGACLARHRRQNAPSQSVSLPAHP